MAKELFIMFIYDTQRCQKEDDDPQDAVLYFHPTWVSDQQKLALCGQLMGATQFFLSAFTCPRIISLNSGKFVVQQFGQYILTVGSDRNIPDWILQHRADSLHCLVQFYHRDLDTISSHCSENGLFFNEKLHQIFETYVPIIQYAGNIFGTIPTIKLPKSASSVFLEALQILQCFQAKGILGGTVLYQNKIVSTQLGSDLTKKLVSTDPYRIKSPAESVATPFHLPVGVQLLYVYVSSHEYNKLTDETRNARKAFQSIPQHKTNQKKVSQGKGSSSKEPPPTMMKRDVSRIFTVPEEEGELDDAVDGIVERKTVNTPDELDETETTNHIPETQEEEEVKAASPSSSPIVEEKALVNMGFVPQTPAEDVNINRVLHAKVLSICCGTESEFKKEDPKVKLKKLNMKENASTNLQDPKVSKIDNKVSRVARENEGRSASLNDLYGTSKALSKAIPMRCYSFGLPQVTHEMCEEHSNNKSPEKYFYNTLADPMHPCFRNDGLPISRALFNEYLANHFYLLRSERSPDITPLENTESTISRDQSLELQKKLEEKTTTEKKESELQPPRLREKQNVSFKQEVSRRSLSLPLKTTTTSGGEGIVDSTNMQPPSYKFGVLESPLERIRPVNTLQLTPLMSKLSILASEERNNSFYSQETTPCDVREMFMTSRNGDKSTRRGSVRRNDMSEVKNSVKHDLPEPEKLVLFICGQQNMALLLLMEEKHSQDPDLIHFLWEVSLSGLGQLETHLHQCLEHLPQGEAVEPYSFICLDPSWDMLQRGGSWGALELDVVSCLHYDFSHCPGLTEIVLRCEDSTVYGYQCGRTEVFYQQPVGSTPGLPTPADLMGTVPLKAKRRLERDHGIILL